MTYPGPKPPENSHFLNHLRVIARNLTKEDATENSNSVECPYCGHRMSSAQVGAPDWPDWECGNCGYYAVDQDLGSEDDDI